MRKYKEDGKVIIEVNDLSFLKEKNHPYGWLKRHFLHLRLKSALGKADKIYVSDTVTGVDLVRYYFVDKERITVNTKLKSSSHKS